jgi:hypothetical protein
MRKPSYTGVVLNSESRTKLLETFVTPAQWEVIAHHMTVNLGPAAKGPAPHLLGEEVRMRVVALGRDDKVVAVKVKTDAPSINEVKHVTLAVNRAAGGKPFDSNKLKDWKELEPEFQIELTGVVTEV